MSSQNICPSCGSLLAGDAPNGLCPACLMKSARPGESVLNELTATWPEGPGAEQSPPPAPGQKIRYIGDYELLEEIAQGGMGIVWKARQNSLNRIVAVKTIRAGALAGPEEVQRFLREAESAANLQHPNIVAIHEVGEHGGQYYYAMDFVDGRDLGTLVQNGPLPPQRAARYVKIIADAIHFAHQRGTLHRDLKPLNVLIDAADEPRITDFGLAKRSTDDSRLTQPGVVMGSPSYMPPEQASGRHDQIGPASDVYSLGAILYELLAARPPFQGPTALATMRLALEFEPVGPRRVNRDIPPDLETICLKCLEKSPGNRYSSAQALAEDLGRFQRGQPVVARPASFMRKTISWVGRHPGLLAATTALIILGLIFGGVYLIEENAFLSARQNNSQLQRTPGPLNETLAMWDALNAVAWAVGTWTILCVIGRARQLSWRDWFEPGAHLRPMGPMGERLRTVAACVGLICTGIGLVTLAKMIQAQVWEGHAPSRSYLNVFASVWWGLFLLGLVARDYRLLIYGQSDRQLSPEQMEPIRQAILERGVPGAIRLFRRTIPEASLAEAANCVSSQMDSLRKEFPDKFDAFGPKMKWNWRAFFICLFVEAALAGSLILAFNVPRESIPALLYYSTAGLVWGIGLVVSLRLKGFWKRLLVTFAGLFMVGAGSEIVGPHFEVWPWVIATVFGAVLMASGYRRS
jgi:serine/threonine protein kinase